MPIGIGAGEPLPGWVSPVPPPEKPEEAPPTPPPPPLPPPPVGAPKVKGTPVSVVETTAPDKFIVRTQIKDAPKGDTFQEFLSRTEIEGRGGFVPPRGVTVEAVKGFATELGMSERAAADTLTKFQRDPTHPEFAPLTRVEQKALIETASPKQDIVQYRDSRGETVIISRDALVKLEGLAGEARFDAMQHLRIMPRGAVYVPGTTGISYLTADQARELREASPRLYGVMTRVGVEAVERLEVEAERILKPYIDKQGNIDILAAANAVRLGKRGIKQALIDTGYKATDIKTLAEQSKDNILIGNQQMPIKDWNTIPEKYQKIALDPKGGWDAMGKAIKADIKEWEKLPLADKYENIGEVPIKERQQYFNEVTSRLWGVTPDKVKDFMPRIVEKAAGQSIDTLNDVAREMLTFGTIETQTFNKPDIEAIYNEQQKEAQKLDMRLVESKDDFTKRMLEDQPPTSKLAKDFAIGMVPVWGTIHHWDNMSIGWKVGSIALDALIVLPLIGGMAAGVRGGASLARAAGRMVLAEVKAPYTVIRHPIRTVKGMVEPIETLVRPKKIPLGATELRETTIRLSLKDMQLPPSQAKKLRDIVTSKAIAGEKAIGEVGGVTAELKSPLLQKTIAPVAIHSTPDVRPFLEGGIVKAGREGGLYVQPQVASRFTRASAFGELPVGNIPGALLIRDAKVLAKMRPSGKLYRGTAEIERVIKVGAKLPPPSQILFTRDIAGDKIALLVFGKKLSPAEIAKLKIVGSVDTIKNIFMAPTRVKRGVVPDYTKFAKLRNEVVELVEEANRLRKAGKIKKANRLSNKIKVIERQAGRWADDINRAYAGRVALRPAGLYFRAGYVFRGRDLIGRAAERIAGVGRVERETKPRVRPPSRVPPSIALIIPPPPPRVPALPPPRVPAPPPRVPPPPPRVPPPPPRVPPPPPRVPPPPPRVPPPPPRVPPPPPRVPPPPPLPLKTDEEKRKIIRDSKGAIAWRQGELRGKDIWHTIKHPYASEADYLTIIGRKPSNTTIVTGPGSAYETIRLRYGKPPAKKVTGDIGFMDFFIEPVGVKRIGIGFKPDPKQETTGDITIGRRTPPITERPPRLSKRGSMRITPKRPALRR